MTDLSLNEKAEQLQFISKTHRKLHNDRRWIELRVLTFTLAIYGVILLSIFKEEIIIPESIFARLSFCIVYILLAFFSIMYLKILNDSNSVNVEIAHFAENEIINIIALNKQVIKSNHESTHTKKIFSSLVWETLVISTASILCSIITFKVEIFCY